VTYLRGVLCGVAAIFVALVGPGLLHAFREIGQQKATGLGAVVGGVLVSLLSPQFWILAILFFGLFFTASRLSSKALRVVLFWTPTVVFSTLGFGYVALLTYLWIHFRKG
jgi:uncharacterized membrane protein